MAIVGAGKPCDRFQFKRLNGRKALPDDALEFAVQT
jgi:hypothetical protein